MAWLDWMVGAAAGLATMRAAIDRGDIDEAARQGALAGPAVIEQGLAARDRPARLAAIAAAPQAEDRAELLEPLHRIASSADRRVAIPAAHAAREISRELRQHERADDLAAEDVARWKHQWSELARDRDRWIELRVVALDTAAALDESGTGVDLGGALGDPDPAFRRAAIAIVAMPVPESLRAALATAVANDRDSGVALAAAAVLCADLVADPPKPILDTLGAAGLDRIKTLVASPGPVAQIKDARRCIADGQRP